MSGKPGIADYSLIGNCRSAALVSVYGSIDWCCIPEFHSPGIFSALLDDKRGGSFSIRPVHDFKGVQRYIGNTNIIECYFENQEGKVRLMDGFAVLDEDDKSHSLFPDHEIIRAVEGLAGSVTLDIEYSPTINYGKASAKLEYERELGILFFFKENTFVFQSTLSFSQVNITDQQLKGRFIIHAGERVIFSLSCSSQCPAIIPEIKKTGWERMQKAIRYWESWSARCKYQGIFKEQVLRSALVLKLLTHAPSGAIIAAPTASLPEEPGGVRNWDYRYCWLRDASFTIRVLIKLGYVEEAHAYMNWILHATRLTRPKLQVVYTVFGESKISEKECNWLTGFRNSVPVRVGNSAHEQFQLDVYGEVLDAVYTYSQLINKFDTESKKFIIGLGKVICKLWDQPDEGIWEIRTSRVHHTHSKVMAWVGLDRIVKLCSKYKWKNVPVSKFIEVQHKIFQQVEQQGFNTTLNHYTRELGGTGIDASLLTLPLVDYCKASSPRMISTRLEVQRYLQKNHFLYRYKDIDDGLPGKEGAFIICNFWLVENLAKSGLVKEAIELFNKTIDHASGSGLLSEETDPFTKELLGNYPQGFSHIGLINAAFAIDEQGEK